MHGRDVLHRLQIYRHLTATGPRVGDICERFWRVIVAQAVLAAAAALLAGCGSEATNPVAAYVGGRAISRQAVEHWASILASEAGEPTSSDTAAHRRNALSLLISGDWIVGEARAQGFRVTAAAVAQQTASAGRGNVAAFEKWSGHNRSDLEFEAAAAVAGADLKRAQAARLAAASRVTQQEIYARYLRAPQFKRREVRYFSIVERYGNARDAANAMRRLRAGGHLGHVIIPEKSERPASLPESGENGVIHTAIFRAKPGVLTGPLPLNRKWAFFRVTRVDPPERVPFVSVRSQIERELSSSAQRRSASRFLAAWRERWRARTSCVGALLVPSCRQYTGDQPVSSLPFKLG